MRFDNEQALRAFAETFACALRPGDCVTLEGDLGVGKTTFARAVIRSAASDLTDSLEVPSPTFTLVQHYKSIPPIAHMDLYRLADPDEVLELGIDAALEVGAVIIEWPSKAADHLPRTVIAIKLEEPADDMDARVLSIVASDTFRERLDRSQKIVAFVEKQNIEQPRRAPFSGDASARNYELVYSKDKALPMILMDAPRQPDGPPIYDDLPYSQVVHLAEDVRPFVAISNLLRDKGFCAPEILAHDMPAGLLLTENLGDGKIVDDNNVPIKDRYLMAVETLAKMHAMQWPSTAPLPDGTGHTIPRYDVRAMQTGLSLLPDWWGKENRVSDTFADQLHALWQPHFDRFQSGYDDLIIRDYHSPNIIWRGDESGVQKIGIIDHQDALIGPGLYDVASLMQDARTVVEPALQSELLDHYTNLRSEESNFDAKQAKLDVATLCAFRNSRLLGLWVRLDVRDRKKRFRSYVSQTKTYLNQALSHPELAQLRAFYIESGVIDE